MAKKQNYVTKSSENEFKAILDALANYEGKAEAGFLGGLSAPESAKKSAINEFGSEVKNIPERPHIRPAFDRSAKTIAKAAAQIPRPAGRLTKKKLLAARNDVLVAAAEMLAEEIRDTIVTMSSPRNAEETIKRKGFDDPLVETGEMRDDVAWRVRDAKGRVISQGKVK